LIKSLTKAGFYDIIEISYKGNIVATVLLLLAEQRLSGCKAWVERVMGECLKTLYLVVSRDHLNIRLDASRKLVGKPINPT